MPPKSQHAHKFKRIKYKSGNTIYFCILPDCNVKLATALSLGKKAICWRCDEEFIMNEYSIRLAKPHCIKCHKVKDIDNSIKIDMNEVAPAEGLSLSERLQQTIKQVQEETEEEEI